MSLFSSFMRFTKGERRGLAILSIMIIVLVVMNQLAVTDRMFSSAGHKQRFAEFDHFLQQTDSLESFPSDSSFGSNNRQSFQKGEYIKRSKRTYRPKEREVTLFEFDPNTLNVQGWQDLGFSEKQAQAAVKYILKAGPLREKEDMKKLFIIDSLKYLELEPYITIGAIDSVQYFVAASSNSREKGDPSEEISIYLNTATAEELQQIKGIGSTFSARIVKYRDLLGGYLSKEQLLEVYGMKQETYDAIIPNVILDEEEPAKIDINQCTAAQLKKHPYCGDWKIANAIADNRDRFGPYRRVEDLLHLPEVNKEWLERIKPYLVASK